MPNAENSIGTILTIGVTPVGKLTKIGAPEMSKGEIDVTTLGSTGGYKEFISDFRDGGMLTFEGFAVSDAGQDALKANFDADTNELFTITLPNGTTISLYGYVSKYKKGDAAVGQGLTFSGEIRVSGVVEYAEVDSIGNSATVITADGGGALTAVSFKRAYAIGTYTYSVQFTTDANIAITVTNATANTTIQLYVDGAYVEDLATTVESSNIAMALNESKLLEVRVWQTDKKPLTYKFMCTRHTA